MEITGDPEALRRSVTEAARRESEAIVAAAEKEAAAILAAARAETAAVRQKLLDGARAEAARRRAALLSSVPAEAARRRGARLEGLLSSVRARASALLAAGPDGGGKGALAALAAAAAAGIGGTSFVFTGAPGGGLPALAGEIERLAGLGRLELAFEEDAAVRGGVLARSADGRRRWDNTFEGRLERVWPQLRRRLAAELESGRAYGR